MKKLLLLVFILISANRLFAQNGLEGIIVEKYYISDENDTTANLDGGVLPVGSVTYRLYVDMLPGYKFQAAYGVPGHELRIATSTLFFNNEDRGATSPTYTKTQAARNTVMLDSWLSVGAACTGNFGVLKSEDNGVTNVVNNYAPQVLQNADARAGIPLTTQDGLIAGTPEAVTAVGISSEIAVFDNQNDGTNGPVFSTSNGSWASLNGSTGPDANINKVLIAQITTNGDFSFELNVQIGTPTGGVQNFVARDAVGNEIIEPTLIYNTLLDAVVPVKKNTAAVSIYPNPVQSNLSLEIKSTNNSTSNFYAIYDVNGKELIRKNISSFVGSHIESIDVKDLSAGFYFLNVYAGNEISTQKFIKAEN